MSVITISRGSYSHGREIAEKLSQKLGYSCISREIIIETSEHFNLPEIKLIRAIHDAPSILDRFTFGKEKFICYARETLLEYAQKDNVIYHGLAGHFFVKDIPNVLKVRIVANIEDRIEEEMKRENISEEEARYMIIKDDEERRKWSMYLYGIDTHDPYLYDVVLHIDKLNVDDVVDILIDIARRPCFQTTHESVKIINDRLLSARVNCALINKFPKAMVKSKDGVVYVCVEAPVSQEGKTTDQVKDILKDIDGIKEIEMHFIPFEAID